MTPTNDRPGSSEAHREASRWIARLEADDVSLEDHQNFRAWLDASPDHRAAYEAVSTTWDRLDALKFLGGEPIERPKPARPSRRAFLLASAGGAVALAAVVVWAVSPSTTFAATYETPVGGRLDATLQDGTTLTLNADTQIEAAYTEQDRRVTMRKGEALFHVFADARDFEIRTPFGAIVTREASFILEVLEDRVRTTLLSGQIRALPKRDRSDAGGASANSSPQELIIRADETSANPLSDQSAARRMAWREGTLVFDGETLRDACLAVGRQTGLRFTFAEPEVGDLRIGGVIDANDHRAFLALLESNLGLRADPGDNGVILLSRRDGG